MHDSEALRDHGAGRDYGAGQDQAETRVSDSLQDDEALRERVREHYAKAARAARPSTLAIVGQPSAEASCCGGGCGCGEAAEDEASFGTGVYAGTDLSDLPAEARAASLGCGNPVAVAELRTGERVLDLGSGGGIDVLLSAKRVGDTGFAYGVDMTDDMLDLARDNAAKVGAANVRFLKGTIEAVPLPDAAVDVVISNCVINLSTDKPAVLGEMFRLLAPGGRIGISDVVAEDHLTPAERGERGSHVGCIAGALSLSEYRSGLAEVGFTDVRIELTHAVADGMHSAIVRAVKPAAPRLDESGNAA